MAARKTPVMQQFWDAKRAYPDAILFFRLGDFYEMFGDDAVLASKLLDLTLTSRNKGKSDEVPMAGVPHHAAHAYIGRLLGLGYQVALCEQMADPSKVKGIVPREVVRVITPGLVTDQQQLDASANNWLAAIEVADASLGLALLDLSTAELRAAELGDRSSLLAELAHAAPRELLAATGAAGADAADTEVWRELVRQILPNAQVRADEPVDDATLGSLLGELANEAVALPVVVRRAVARALRFARACNPKQPLPVRRIGQWDAAQSLGIDRIAQSHLELVTSSSGDRSTTLLGVIDATCTAPGARLLRRRLLSPLMDIEQIRRRLDQVELFVVHARLREQVRAALGRVGDLERLGVRAALGEATPRDLGALRDGLAASRDVVGLLSAPEDPALRECLGLGAPVDTVSDVAQALERALVERPPAQAKEGAIFVSGFDTELDELDELRKHGTERLVACEAELRENTQIGNLKVRFTRVFGWYIEVSKSQLGRVPSTWRRKQTVATGERFTTPELDDLAERVASAEERHRERELELLTNLGQQAAAASARIADLASRVARWDVAQALADVAHRYDYCRPEVDESDALEIVDGRHPVVERLAALGRFVPNDVKVDLNAERLWLITGPNMAGKSTLLRQVALSVILAQMGSYVPARVARLGVVDKVLSRVGASDNLAQGESTFMVEMRETAAILRAATKRSLVILDEIGRGTSTFDGLAIAWSVAEYLDEVVGCRGLFATHYHELTALDARSEHVANYSVTARELDQDVVFLHRLVKGPASRSYGVAVAKLAGLPESVLARARALLNELEGQGPSGTTFSATARRTEPQLDLFASSKVEPSEADAVVATLRELDLDRLSGLEALQLLTRLKKKLS